MAFKYFSLQKKIFSYEKHLLEGIDLSFNKLNLVDLFKKKLPHSNKCRISNMTSI